MEDFKNLEYLKYLEAGEQTKPGELVQEIASKVVGDNWNDKILSIFDVVGKTLRYDKSNKNLEFRRRTAEDILGSGYYDGCTDRALVFVAVARTVGIPSRFIEAIDKKWLNDSNLSYIKGHCYAGVFDETGVEHLVDPSKDQIDIDLGKDGRVFVAAGKDSWDIGITDFETLKQKIVEFKAKKPF